MVEDPFSPFSGLEAMAGVRANIVAMQGYVPGEQPRETTVIKLNTNENPYPPSPKVMEAIQNCLTGEKLRKYPDPLGADFRKSAANVLGIDAEAILIGNGSDDILTILTRTLVPEKGTMVSLTPSYILYRNLAEIQNANFIEIPFAPDWQLPDPSSIPEADLILIANPNSPSGTVISHHSIEGLIQATKAVIVIDEAYGEFASANALRFASDRVIITRTFSKFYALAGIRFGFGVASPNLIHQLLKVKDSYNCDVLSLAAAKAAIEDQEYYATLRKKILLTRSKMSEQLTRFGFHVQPSESNFLWCTRSDRPVKPIYEALKERRILIRYMKYGSYGDGLRISVGTDEEIQQLWYALETILSSGDK